MAGIITCANSRSGVRFFDEVQGSLAVCDGDDFVMFGEKPAQILAHVPVIISDYDVRTICTPGYNTVRSTLRGTDVGQGGRRRRIGQPAQSLFHIGLGSHRGGGLRSSRADAVLRQVPASERHRHGKRAARAILALYAHRRAHRALAESYAAMRRVPDAEKEFRAAIKLRPDIPGLHLGLGQVYAGAAQWAKAEEEFRAEAQLRPGDGETACRLGSALLEGGKIHEARQQLERADRLQPEMPETLYALGKAASLDGETALAEKSWKAVAAMEKESQLAAQAHFGLATLYRKRGETQKAELEMSEFRRLQKRVPAR